MLAVQILSIVFIVMMLYVIRIHKRKNELPKVEALFWSVSLVILGIIIAFEQTANYIRNVFHVTRLTDVIVIVAFMGTFTLLIENRIQIQKLRSKLEKVVRKNAIDSKSK